MTSIGMDQTVTVSHTTMITGTTRATEQRAPRCALLIGSVLPVKCSASPRKMILLVITVVIPQQEQEFVVEIGLPRNVRFSVTSR